MLPRSRKMLTKAINGGGNPTEPSVIPSDTLGAS